MKKNHTQVWNQMELKSVAVKKLHDSWDYIVQCSKETQLKHTNGKFTHSTHDIHVEILTFPSNFHFAFQQTAFYVQFCEEQKNLNIQHNRKLAGK